MMFFFNKTVVIRFKIVSLHAESTAKMLIQQMGYEL